MASAAAAGTIAPAATLPAQWRRSLWLVAICWSVLLLVFFTDIAAMVMLWWDSSTFNHILLIPAIIGWLIWQRRDDLEQITPQGWWPPLVVFASALFLWLLGHMAGLAVARQMALIVMLQSSLLAIIGPRAGSALAFPIFYMFFMLPLARKSCRNCRRLPRISPWLFWQYRSCQL